MGRQGDNHKLLTPYYSQLPIPNYQLPITNCQFSILNSPCPIPYFTLCAALLRSLSICFTKLAGS